MKKQFKVFKTGTIRNQLNNYINSQKILTLKYKSVELQIPSRINAMAIDPSGITVDKNGIYTPGEIILKVGIYKYVCVSVDLDSDIVQVITNNTRKSLLIHAALLMKKALGIKHGFKIEFQDDLEYKHCGLGSSSQMIISVMAAINELYDNVIPIRDLLKYAAQNHGEETEDNEYLKPVQAIGGSAAACLYDGSVMIIAGESELVLRQSISTDYNLNIAIPINYKPLNGEALMELEEQNLYRFLETGKKYGQVIAYQTLHKVIPDLVNNSLSELSKLIFDYRFNMGSIENCSFIYPKMAADANILREYYRQGEVEMLGISSVGPAFFFISSSSTNSIETKFEELGYKIIHSKLVSESYRIVSKEAYYA